MKQLPPEMVLAMNERFQSAPWIWLLEAEIPTDPPQVVRFANYSTEVQFDADDVGAPQVFVPMPFSFGTIEFDSEGNLPQLPLSISNVSRELLAVALNNDMLTGLPARLMLVNENTLDNPSARLDFQLSVGSSVATELEMTFSLSSDDLHSILAPQRRMQRDFCDHEEYGGELCGFDIPGLDPGLAILGPCPRTQEACDRRGDLEVAAGRPRTHPQRIGFFKGLPVSAT